MKTSIVPELLNSKKIKIFDDNFIPVSICEKSDYLFDFSKVKFPSIILDVYEAGKYKEVEIKRVQLPDLDKAGLRMVAIEISGTSRRNIRNYRGQRRAYLLKRKEDPLEGSTELFREPKDHCLEMDIINKRFRIRGKNAYPYIKNENASKWVDIE